jgi:hypothetical protein
MVIRSVVVLLRKRILLLEVVDVLPRREASVMISLVQMMTMIITRNQI